MYKIFVIISATRNHDRDMMIWPAADTCRTEISRASPALERQWDLAAGADKLAPPRTAPRF
jgi:hypothetical protein